MFDNVQESIKAIAKFIFWSSIVVAIIWLIYSIDHNAKLNESYYEIKVELSLIPPVLLFFGGIVTSFIMYGFGEIIEVLKNIDSKIINNEGTKNIDYKSTVNSNEYNIEQDSSHM
ncbi:hypothetical protein [Lachnoclostridium phytofermentans]|uniref:hypothetical protein n=1 Tax=Lachnoclostridium phytofermentans TaxID=66219 RepID=UPI0005A03F03|nr:hypothetical protein [Lachnoclostridium phytofermentans]